jgi:hypothetical protein
MGTAPAYPPIARSARTPSSAACRNCCCNRTSGCTSRAAALLLLIAGAAASAQTGPGVDHDRAALAQAICRQYAVAQFPLVTAAGRDTRSEQWQSTVASRRSDNECRIMPLRRNRPFARPPAKDKARHQRAV